MQKKESRLEFFKSAIISTVKSISKKKNCEVKFGKSINHKSSEKFINLPASFVPGVKYSFIIVITPYFFTIF